MPEMIAHYNQVAEEARLRQGIGALELARTQELIVRHLPKPPARVLDVGGAAGVYSEWLGNLGYEAHLIDPVARHVEQARSSASIASAQVGDARRLESPDESFDAVLLMGPLYHLTDRGDRVAALAEARRVLRRDGVLFAAAICRFAPLMDALARGFIDDPQFEQILERDLRDGQHRNTTDNPDYFTTAFFHRPEQLTSEVSEAGFSQIELTGVEGPGWLARNFNERWADPARRQQLLGLLRRVECESALLGVSLHWLLAARKP